METTAIPRPGDPGPSLVGRLLDDRYRLDSVIARGGMGTVYLAIDTRLDRIVAVKVMHRQFADDPDFVARFSREAKAAVKVSGPEVVAVHDQGTDPQTGLAYLVMEHVRGQNLRQLILATGPLSPARAMTIMEPVLRALANAHAAGIVHRDVKPENVLLGDNGSVKVADFGLARAAASTNITQTGAGFMGTATYYAPEQAAGTTDARSDVYAAGVVLWELLVGSPPYTGDDAISVALKHIQQDVPAPSTVMPTIPPALDALVVRATRRDPLLRPADAGEFLRELKAATADQPRDFVTSDSRTLVVPRVVGAPPPRAPLTPSAKAAKQPKRRRKGLIAIVVLALLAVAALGSGFYLGSYRYTHAPAVKAMRLDAAIAKLTRAGLREKTAAPAFSDIYPAGQVMAQRPSADGRIRKHGTVILVVSLGADLRTVPSYTGKTLAQETAALKTVGLVVAPDPDRTYSGQPAGTVISTDPAPGQRLKPGTAVRLTLSLGPPPVDVPDLSTQGETDAELTLTGLGLKYTVTTVFSDTIPKGVVVSNLPDSGTLPKGSTVALTVSKGQDLVAVPDVVGHRPGTAKKMLEAAGFVAVRKDAFLSTGLVVYNCDPQPGTKIKRGATVTYYVS